MAESLIIGILVNWFILGPFLREQSRAERAMRSR